MEIIKINGNSSNLIQILLNIVYLLIRYQGRIPIPGSIE